MHRVLLASMILVATASLAHADGIAPPPRHCPYGSFANTGHFSGPYCQVGACITDDDCEAYAISGGRGAVHRHHLVCRPAALCVGERRYAVYHGRSRTPSGMNTLTVARGECAADDLCAEGECQRARFCVPAEDDRPEPPPEASEPDAPDETSAPDAPEETTPRELSTDDPPAPEPERAVGPAAPTNDSGGWCAVSHREGAATWAGLALLALLARWRRRSSRPEAR